MISTLFLLIDGKYHSKFYKNIKKNEGLILEAKGRPTHLQTELNLTGYEATG